MSRKQLGTLLDLRRRRLGMTFSSLAKRSGVSMPTVVRILLGREHSGNFANVVAIAEALGLGVRFDEKTKIEDLREKQARRKAERLVGLVQGSSGLEGQAVNSRMIRQMVQKTTHELLVGSRRKLWGE
jgi:transcriptional regulator with XRE-family HTH domain